MKIVVQVCPKVRDTNRGGLDSRVAMFTSGWQHGSVFRNTLRSVNSVPFPKRKYRTIRMERVGNMCDPRSETKLVSRNQDRHGCGGLVTA